MENLLLSDQAQSVNSVANIDGNYLLYSGIKSLLRCDDAEVVSGIAKYVMTQHRVLKAGSALMELSRETWLPPFAALLGSITRFLEVHQGDRRDGAVWVARLGNERRAIQKAIQISTELNWSELKLGRPPDLSGLKAFTGRIPIGPWRLFQIAKRLHRNHQYFRVLRAIELIGYYARFLQLFQEGHYRIAVMSSHSNPHGIAFNLAARRAGVPVVLITHGMPVRPLARLKYDLALVHCESARRAYVEERCQLGRVFIHGRRQEYHQVASSIPDPMTVGVFLCKDVNEKRLQTVVGQLLQHSQVSRVLIRPHPKNLWRGLDSWIAESHEPRLKRSDNVSVSEDLQFSDIVLAGNSSVLVDAVTAGKPAAYVSGLDYAADDMHQFVRRNLIFHLKGDRVDLASAEILDFYRRPEWLNTLRLFANIDEEGHVVLRRVVSEMSKLAERQSSL